MSSFGWDDYDLLDGNKIMLDDYSPIKVLLVDQKSCIHYTKSKVETTTLSDQDPIIDRREG